MGRFDYVKYDEKAQAVSAKLKAKMEEIEAFIEMNIGKHAPAEKTLALRSLETTFMWCGKAIRNDQIAVNGSVELQEERCNS